MAFVTTPSGDSKSATSPRRVRRPGPGSSASAGLGSPRLVGPGNGRVKMASIIKCSSCDASLNLPPEAEGRKVKCPRCGVKFLVSVTSPPDAGDPDRPSTLELKGRADFQDLPVLPNSGADLRETFGLPMMTDEEPPRSKSAGASGVRKGEPAAADAAALFADDPAPRKKKAAAESRAQARRCPTCGGVVQRGMSLCQTCGLDLESGMRVALDDEFAPPPVRDTGPPVPIIVVGGLSFAASAALVVYSFVLWSGGTPGAIYFVPVALFGTYAAVQFLRRKSVKLLLTALTLGAAINMAALVFMPIYTANADVKVGANTDITNPDSADETIASPQDELDMQKIGTGFTILFLYAVVSIYLLSPGVHKHFKR